MRIRTRVWTSVFLILSCTTERAISELDASCKNILHSTGGVYILVYILFFFFTRAARLLPPPFLFYTFLYSTWNMFHVSILGVLLMFCFLLRPLSVSSDVWEKKNKISPTVMPLTKWATTGNLFTYSFVHRRYLREREKMTTIQKTNDVYVKW